MLVKARWFLGSGGDAKISWDRCVGQVVGEIRYMAIV